MIKKLFNWLFNRKKKVLVCMHRDDTWRWSSYLGERTEAFVQNAVDQFILRYKTKILKIKFAIDAQECKENNMGQMTYGLIFGIPNYTEVENLDSEIIWDEYEKIDDSIGVNYDSNFLGFYVAVGASGKDGVPYLEGFRITDPLAYAEQIKEASDKWWKFAAWCKKKDIILPTPELWLIECEVA
jgi:hypothetical protein